MPAAAERALPPSEPAPAPAAPPRSRLFPRLLAAVLLLALGVAGGAEWRARQYQPAPRGPLLQEVLTRLAADAEAEYTRALETNPRDAEALARRGLLRHHVGRHAEALADLDEAARLSPLLASQFRAERDLSRRALGR